MEKLVADASELADAQQTVRDARNTAALAFLPRICAGRQLVAQMWVAHHQGVAV
jgi:hypothetical protein